MARDLGGAAIARGAPRLDGLAILVVGKADGTVIAPLPASVGDDGPDRSVVEDHLELRKELGLGTVLVLEAPCTARSAVPAIGQLHRQLVLSLMEQPGHIVGLVLDALTVVDVAGSQAERPHLLPAQTCFVETAGGYVETRAYDAFVNREGLAEAVHGIALALVHAIVAADPGGAPRGDAHLEGCLAPFSGIVVLIPQADLPADDLPVREVAGIRCEHGVGLDLAAVPAVGDDLVCGLSQPTLAVPHEARIPHIYADGVVQILGAKPDCIHGNPPMRA